MGPVPPAKGNLSIRERDQAMVGDGDSMSIAAEIAENIFRAAEWALAVDDPVVTVEFANEGREKPSGPKDGAVFRESRSYHRKMRG